MGKLGVSERFACQVLGQHRSVQRKVPRAADDEAALTESIIGLAQRLGATVTAGSRPCFELRAGSATTSGWSGSGGRRG
jgi:hypothetical protein